MSVKLRTMDISKHITTLISPDDKSSEGYELHILDEQTISGKKIECTLNAEITNEFWEVLDLQSSFSIYPGSVVLSIKKSKSLDIDTISLFVHHKETESLIFHKNMLIRSLINFYKNNESIINNDASKPTIKTTGKTMKKIINDPVLKELDTFVAKDNVLSLPKEKLKHYAKIKAILQKAGGKYSRNTFVFHATDSAQDIKDSLTSGEKLNDKKKFQFFATTEPLAIKLVDKLDVQKDDKWLEPSAGQGAIADKLKEKSEHGTTVELMEKNVYELKEKGYNPIEMDFLEVTTAMIGHKFDKIGANPPFTKDQDIIHIQHMYNEHLAENGILSSYASQSWLNGSNKRQVAFKAWLEEVGGDVELIDSGEFKESGTSIATSLITIKK